ncbi:V-type ATP synthase subunit D [Candidatus Woesearchaeota archaeon]|nr:V-type ATP synthase subunit D [Candidatus Woesearchaeota archaeon]
MTQNVKPTRSELMELKKRIKLAKSGYNLLKKKRDGLILDFFEILKKVKNVRGELTEEYKRALQKMSLARVIESDLKIRSVALAVANSPEVEIGRKNIMGVVVPNIGEVELRKTALNRGYGLYTSAAVDEAAAEYEKVVEKVVRAAEIETSMRKLLKEIEKTKRRVNALEFEVIPKLDRTKSFIQLRLEEAERENIFRMKIIKRKHAA